MDETVLLKSLMTDLPDPEREATAELLSRLWSRPRSEVTDTDRVRPQRHGAPVHPQGSV